jgi:hypothetical protein
MGLIAGGAAFALVTWKRRRQAVKSRAQEQLAIESDRAREAALQTYLDRIDELSLKHNLAESEKGDKVTDVARARTLTVLRQLDGGRKGLLLRFLYESELESDLIGRLAEPEGKGDQRAIVAASHGTNLRRTYLESADLREAQLAGANLKGAQLRGADLTGALLQGADLRGANLAGASLVAADLQGAKLDAASLKGADLRHAKLAGAALAGAYLAGVDLSGATVTGEQLAQTRSLEGATMPDGTLK